MSSKLVLKLQNNSGFTLIGGGSLLITSAKYLSGKGFPVLCVLAPRHSSDSTIQALNELQCHIVITENINDDASILELLSIYNRMCLCFGPAWIFSNHVLEKFQGRIFNFNGIPLPQYLGGAHYSWQILNNNIDAGIYIQQITEVIDRGPFLKGFRFKIAGKAPKPADYERQYFEQSHAFVNSFWDEILSQDSLSLKNELVEWRDLLYFPRLNTEQNAWIDWSWTADQISRFCNAFDSPYPGARTFLNGEIVIFKNVTYGADENIHPFTAGIIVRKNSDQSIVVAANQGFLYVKEVLTTGTLSMRLGNRFSTPTERLINSKTIVSYDSSGLAG